jgi:hypothetical protein
VVSPNPFSSEFTAQFNVEKSMTVTAELITLKSRIVHTERLQLEAGFNEYHFKAMDGLESGVFVFRILDEGKLLGYAKAIKK